MAMQLASFARHGSSWLTELLFAVQLPLFIFAISFSAGSFEVLGQGVASYLTGQGIMIAKALGIIVPTSLFLILFVRKEIRFERCREILRNHCYIIAFIVISGVLLLTAVKPVFSLFKWIILASSYVALFSLLCQYQCRYRDAARHYLFKHLLYAFSLLLIFPCAAIITTGPSTFFGHARALIGCGIAHPNLLSAFLCYGFYFGLFYNALQGYSYGRGRPSPSERILRLLIIWLFPFLVLIANSRGVYMAMLGGIGITYIIWFFVRQTVDMYLTTVSLALLFLGVTIGVIAGWIPTEALLSSVSRYEDGSDLTSLTGRTDIWDAALSTNDWKSYLFGNGFAVMMPELAFKLETGTLYGTHNTPMMVLFATGVFGLITYLLFYLQNAMRIPVILYYDGYKHAGFYVLIFATFAIHQNVETFFGLNLDGIFSLFLLFFAFDSDIHNESA